MADRVTCLAEIQGDNNNEVIVLWRSDVTLWRIEMSAAVVDPDGRKANCSERFRQDNGDRKAGYRNWRTTMRSVTLDSADVIDIGRK